MSHNIGEQMQKLYRQYGNLPGITIELYGELLAVAVENQAAAATVFLQGAQLSHYQKKSEQPIIWCSELNKHRGGQSLRGGIPICWPWFGDLERNSEAVKNSFASENGSAHGFARNLPWQLKQVQIVSNQLTKLTLNLYSEDGISESGTLSQTWQSPCDLELVISIGAQLAMEMKVTNCGDKPIAFTQALHSYFAISNIDEVSIKGLSGLDYIDCMDDWKGKNQQGIVKIGGEIDRIYHLEQTDIQIIDPVWKRIITLSNSGSRNAVLWNPWTDKSRGLSNFGDNAYREMLCIETANAADNYIQLEPGENSSMGFSIDSHSIE